MTRKTGLAWTVAGLLGLLILWAYGLYGFVYDINKLKEPTVFGTTETTDAIVVLTGGHERVETGLELLSAGKAKKLFISGVHPGLSLERLIGSASVSNTLRNCCVILGHTAESTRGNAEETLAWMNAENFHSLRLVTANYHMTRSLLIFHSILPNTNILPHPIMPENVILDDWWFRPGTTKLLVTEYLKYLFARARIEMGV